MTPAQLLSQSFAHGKKALIPFLTAGYPNPTATLPLMQALVRAGADIIELGMPFSDPMADGPIIEAAGHLALSQGMNVSKVLELVAAFRATNQTTPIVLMGYANPIEAFGLDDFAQAAKSAGVNGVLLVDVPPEEAESWHMALQHVGLALIYLVAPTTPDERVALMAKRAEGYLYTVSLKGVTGSAALDTEATEAVKAQVSRIRAYTDLPLCVGFGVRSAEQARALSACADGVIVGSRLIEIIGEAYAEKATPALALSAATAAAEQFIQTLKSGMPNVNPV